MKHIAIPLFTFIFLICFRVAPLQAQTCSLPDGSHYTFDLFFDCSGFVCAPGENLDSYGVIHDLCDRMNEIDSQKKEKMENAQRDLGDCVEEHNAAYAQANQVFQNYLDKAQEEEEGFKTLCAATRETNNPDIARVRNEVGCPLVLSISEPDFTARVNTPLIQNFIFSK